MAEVTAGGMAEDPAGGAVLRLGFHPPYDVPATLANLAAHGVPGLDRTDREHRRHTRVIPAPHGPVPLTVDFDDDEIRVRMPAAAAADRAWLTQMARRWLDLDADPGRVTAVLGDDPVVGELVRAHPGRRIIGYPEGFEGAVLTVLGQQVSLARAGTLAGRLVRTFGTPLTDGFVAFPTAERLAGADVEYLRNSVGLTGARARTVQALAAAVADGLALDPAGDHAQIRDRLLAVPGIGPWTADYLAVRALGDRDAFTAGDLVLRRALGGVSAREAERLSQSWRPLRAYALLHLWSSAYR